MKYIPADKLIAEIERYENTAIDAYNPLGEDADFWHGRVVTCEDLKTFITSLQQEQPMPDSTKLIEFWNEDKKMLKEKDFRDDAWRLAYNAFMCGFGRGIAVNKQEQPEVDLEKFTKKMDDWKARYNHPDNIPIKATMAFTARMFYQYPNVARQWYDNLPKATMD